MPLFLALALLAAPAAPQEKPGSLPVPISLSYFGETLTHPGAVLGTELSLLSSTHHALLVTLNLGGYVHLKNHVGVFLSSELGYRLTLSGGLMLEMLVGAGWLTTFVQGKLFAADAAGNVHPTTDTGRPAFMPSASVGFGWDLSRKNGPPVTAFLRLTGFGQYPFNERTLPHVAVQLGARLR